jgi:hypothetical protein
MTRNTIALAAVATRGGVSIEILDARRFHAILVT